MRSREEIESDLERTFGEVVDDIVGSLAVEVLLDIRDLLSREEEPKPQHICRNNKLHRAPEGCI